MGKLGHRWGHLAECNVSDGVCKEAEVSPDPHIWTQVGAGGRNSWIPVGFSWIQGQNLENLEWKDLFNQFLIHS